jgi:DNA-binding CsgD family transcriptional regulator
MIDTSPAYLCPPMELLAMRTHLVAIDAALAANNAFLQANAQDRILHKQRIAFAAAQLCNDQVATEHRCKAFEDLSKQWNPYPFDPLAKRALRAAGPQGRAELRRDLCLAVLDAAAEAACIPKARRIGRKWLKGEGGGRALLTLLDLEADDFLRTLRTMLIKEYERLALGEAPVLVARELRDSDQDWTEPSTSIETAEQAFEGLENLLDKLSRRELQLWRLLAQGVSPPNAARLMHITPSTARGFLRRIRRKLNKPV